MTTRMTINGVSTCAEAGTEKYERFQSGIGRRRRTLVQYDYRHPIDRELFSCVKPTLDECRAHETVLDLVCRLLLEKKKKKWL